MATATLDVRGQKLRTQTQRRYIAVAVRPEAVHTANGIYVPFVTIIKRSDKLETTKTAARRHSSGPGAITLVIDTVTGREL